MKSLKLIVAASVLFSGVLMTAARASLSSATDSIKAHNSAQLTVQTDPDDDLTILGQRSQTPGRR